MSEHAAQPSRREFAAALAAAGLASGTAAAAADEPKPPSEAEALLLVIRARYGKHIEKEQLPQILGGIRRSLASAERLQRVKLTNADEPAVLFRADLP
jgi:hypothetical protein